MKLQSNTYKGDKGGNNNTKEVIAMATKIEAEVEIFKILR